MKISKQRKFKPNVHEKLYGKPVFTLKLYKKTQYWQLSISYLVFNSEAQSGASPLYALSLIYTTSVKDGFALSLYFTDEEIGAHRFM